MKDDFKLPSERSEYHPIIREWFREWDLRQPVADLTDRDIYRFQVTSVFLKKLGTTKIRLKDSSIEGVFNVLFEQEELAIRITEKMRRSHGLDNPDWTAFPNHHPSGLIPRGLVRFAVSTYPVKEFVETKGGAFEQPMNALIKEILVRPEKERRRREELEKQHAIWQEKQAIKDAIREKAMAKEQLWEKLISASDDWHQTQRLRGFKQELMSRSDFVDRLGFDGDVGEFEEWLERKIAFLDPFSEFSKL